MGTGASRMMEPLPLARSAESPDVAALCVCTNRDSAARVVMPMSKHRPLTEYLPVVHHSTYLLAWSSKSHPTDDRLSASASAMLVSSVHSPGARPCGPPAR